LKDTLSQLGWLVAGMAIIVIMVNIIHGH
jgi:hypothetical protein